MCLVSSKNETKASQAEMLFVKLALAWNRISCAKNMMKNMAQVSNLLKHTFINKEHIFIK